MPVRSRKSKARAGEVKAWSCLFMCGADFFDDLGDVGLTEPEAMAVAEETWHRIGEAVLLHLEDFNRDYRAVHRPYWAEVQFGPPGKRRRHV